VGSLFAYRASFMSGWIARSVSLLGLVSAGCYNPQLSNPSFYCHADDNPACPDGQTCVDGRCVGPGIHFSGDDLSMPGGGHDDGGGGQSTDLAHAASHDLATKPPVTHDLAIVTTPGLTGCSGLIGCVNNCPTTDMTCPTDCENNATSNGQTLFNNLINCIVQQCPSTSHSDPCYDPNSTACSNCFTTAQSGACSSDLNACTNDLP
jgi:hypothetical protein